MGLGMTRTRIEPVPGYTGHDGPCDGCQETYRRVVVVTAAVTATVTMLGLFAIVAYGLAG